MSKFSVTLGTDNYIRLCLIAILGNRIEIGSALVSSSVSLEQSSVLPGAGVKQLGSAIFDSQWVPLI